MIAMRNGETVRVPLEEVAGKLKMVDPNCQMIKEVKLMGISFKLETEGVKRCPIRHFTENSAPESLRMSRGRIILLPH